MGQLVSLVTTQHFSQLLSSSTAHPEACSSLVPQLFLDQVNWPGLERCLVEFWLRGLKPSLTQ